MPVDDDDDDSSKAYSHQLDEKAPAWASQFFEKLYWHDKRSQERYESLRSSIPNIPDITKLTELNRGNKMGLESIQDKVNINVGGESGGAGMAALIAAMNSGGGDSIPALIAAMGNNRSDPMAAMAPLMAANNNNSQNALWPIILLALLGRGGGGLLGGGGEGVSGLNNLQGAIDTNAILSNLGDIKAAVPLAEAQVQLALAGAQSDIIGNQTTIATAQAIANQLTNQNIANATASIIASESALKDTVTTYGVANLAATKDSQYALTTTVRDDGDKTRALITSFNEANLQRQLAVAEAALIEQRAIGRSREVEVNVSQTVNQNQQQLQAQAQQQQQFQILANLSAVVGNLANDIQVVRQGQTIFNSGTMAASGTQTAANTRVS